MAGVTSFPFKNQLAMGLGTGDGISQQQVKDIAAQVAVSADGRIHSDLALLKNWKRFTSLSIGAGPTPCGIAPCFDPKTRRWLVFGMNIVTECEAVFTVSGTRWHISSSIEASAPGANLVPFVSYANRAGVILVGGSGTGGGSTINKLRESTDGGDTWTFRAIGASDTSRIVSICYSERLRIWVASQEGAEPGIWSSTDRITWTKRSTAKAGNMVLRDTSSPLFVYTGAGSSNNYGISVDGINWTAQSFPTDVAADEQQGVWNDEFGFFYVPTAAGGIYRSATGTTSSWTQVSTFNDTQLCVFGKALVRGDGQISVDGAVTWFPVIETADPDFLPVCAPGLGVGLFSDVSSGTALLSTFGGF